MSDFNSLVQYTVENISRPVKYIIYKLTEFIRVVDKFIFRQVPAGAASGYATIEKVEGNTVAWNQLVDTSDTSCTVPNGHKYYSIIGGTKAIATSDGTSFAVTGGTDIVIDLTSIFGSANEPSTVADFEAWREQNGLLSVADYNAGELLSCKMESLKSIGFNQWDEEWESGMIDSNGQNTAASNTRRSKNYIPILPGIEYFWCVKNHTLAGIIKPRYYDGSKNYIGAADVDGQTSGTNVIRRMPANARYFRFWLHTDDYGSTTYNNDICINISDPAKNGTYQPYMTDSADIDVTTITGINTATNVREVIFPNGMKQADREGTVKDTLDLLSDTATVKVGSRAYQAGDESDTDVITDGTTTYYALTTPIGYTDLQDANGNPLTPRYKVEQGGTEHVLPVNTTHTLCDQTQLIANSDYNNNGELRTFNGRYATPKIDVRNLNKIKLSYTASRQLHTACCTYSNQSLVTRNSQWMIFGETSGVLDVSNVDEVTFFWWYGTGGDEPLPTISALAVDTIPPTTVAPTLTTTYTKDNN